MMYSHEEAVLEMARLERECLARIRAKVASQQLGELWRDLAVDCEPLEGTEASAA